MKREQAIKSIAITAFASLMIGSVSPASTHAAEANPKKSTWTAKTAPKENIVQIAPKAGASNDGKALPPTSDESLEGVDRIIVKYKPGHAAGAASILPAGKAKSSAKLAGIDASVIELTSADDVKTLLDKLNKDPNVLYAEPDRKLYKSNASADSLNQIKKIAEDATLPDDTYFDKQWGLHNTGQTPPFNLNNPFQEGYPGVPGLDIKAPEAWTVTKGNPDVVVAVMDSGIQIDHPDLTDSIWTNPKERAGNGTDDDNNHYADDVHGWNFVEDNNQIYSELDLNSEGTAVAGIIAGSVNNGTGLAGIAPNVKIMPLKYIGAEYGYLSDLIEAIEYAENNGAQIADISAQTFEYSQALKDAIDASSMLFVTGAGDYRVNIDGTPSYPAAFDSPNILSVTGIDNEGQIVNDANIGFGSVDVAAPGEAIAAAVPVSNTGLAAEIHDPANGSKAIFNGIAFENILDEEDADYDYRQDAFDTAMDYLEVSKSDPDHKILLVQDDLSNYTALPSTSKLAKYTDLLQDYAGVDIVQASPDGGDGPTLAKMQAYDAVIWFTGMADRYYVSNLTANDQKNLTDFLHGGGHLMLTGTNVLNGPTEYMGEEDSSIIDTPFVKDVLHLAFMDQYFYSNAIGVPGTIYDYKDYPLDEDKDSYNWIISRDPSIAKIDLLNVTKDFKGSSYGYMRGTSIAAAHAAGAAALVLSQETSLSALAVKQRVINSGTKISSLSGKVASGRMINAYQALTDDEIPGSPFTGDSISNGLDDSSDLNDVYAVELHAGENIGVSMTGDKNTDFDLYLYAPDATTVNLNEHILAYSENDKTSAESIDYKVTTSGTYYLNVFAHKGKGAYSLTLQRDNQIGDYEDSSSSLAFSGPWKQVSGSVYTGGSKKEIDAAGNVEFAFVGSYFSWIGSKNADQGIADVYVDGVKVASPSLYSAKSLNKQIVFEKMLPFGQHAIKIAWTGKHDPSAKKSAGTFINVDAFNVANLIQDNDPGLTLSGQWTTSYSVKHLGGRAIYSDKAGSYAKLKFVGTQAKLYALVGKDRGKANIYIDDKLVTPDAIDLYGKADQYRAVVFESNVLAAGAHTIKIVNLGEKNPSSAGTIVSLDALSVTP
ncbi:S8 family serine peptidase [Paenibacillus glycinis]|uniref:S8 family serine peptidase n=1 Tax=Paenibacillus glycinis TaxID=2697035 RepID=A0ABW9XYP8_9BACL|nr:S8 family serine peptidase [Paenibacillus glycinis]NBD27754.1 S8 family serine peptidase [Paenibacillus glycinis]